MVSYRGRGLALVGPRGAGKTTLAMHLLARGGRLLGSDMGLVRIDARRLQARAMPHLCRIAPATMAENALLHSALPRLHDAVDGRPATPGEGKAKSGSPNQNHLAGPVFFGGKYELIPPHVDRIFGRTVHLSSMPLDAVIFPRFRLGSRSAMCLLDTTEVMRRLQHAILTDPPLADWLPLEQVAVRKHLWSASLAAWEPVRLAGYEWEFGTLGQSDWGLLDRSLELLVI
jgi:hypothetical protein